MKKIFLFIIIFFFVINCNNNKIEDIINGNFIEPPDTNAIPLLLKPDNNNLITDSFYLIWTSVNNADKYLVEIYNNNSYFIKETDTEQLQVSISEITTSSNKFYWRVTALFDGIKGNPSEVFVINILVSEIIYVSTSSTGSDNGHGLSNDPFKTLEDAVEVSNILPGIQKIYISEGSYVANVSILDDVEIYGGYSSTDWSIRDIKLNKTFIRPRYITAFALSSPITRSTIIDGIIFDHLSGYSIDLLISMSASPVVSNNIFYNSSEDASPMAIIVQNYSNPLIRNCTFSLMSSSFTGSKPSFSSNIGNPEVLNCTFYGSVNINGGMLRFEENYSEGSISINTKTKDDLISFVNNHIYNYVKINYYNTGKINLYNNFINSKSYQNESVSIILQKNNNPSTSSSNENIIFIGGNYIESGTSQFNECLNFSMNYNLTSSISLYIINNTFKIGNCLESTVSSTCLNLWLEDTSTINALVLNNIFIDTWNRGSLTSAIRCDQSILTISYNAFVGTSFIERAVTGYYLYSVDGLNTLIGSISNTYDYDYNNVFNNINDPDAPYSLKSSASCAIDKGYNIQISGTNISDRLVTDITLTNLRLSGGIIDIGAYEYN